MLDAAAFGRHIRFSEMPPLVSTVVLFLKVAPVLPVELEFISAGAFDDTDLRPRRIQQRAAVEAADDLPRPLRGKRRALSAEPSALAEISVHPRD